MSKIIVNGGKKLFGIVQNQVSKNATLPILSASLLFDKVIRIKSVPALSDVENMLKILSIYNVKITRENEDVIINANMAELNEASGVLNKSMRSSIFVLGPCLARFGRCCITMPGGCKIGKRPIDVHLNALKRMGVKIVSLKDKIYLNSSNAHPSKIKLRIPSVGATENIIMFACCRKGKTTILNSAKEPEIIDLCNFLNSAGARIKGAGTSKITIYGVEKLDNTTYKPMYDRIVSGTVMIAVAATGGDVIIKNACYNELESVIAILKRVGCMITKIDDNIRIVRLNSLKNSGDISTGFYPEFPTDLQSIMLVLMSVCPGKSKMEENVFENRLSTARALKKMGVRLKILDKKTVEIYGSNKLNSANFIAKDLRGGAGLVVAGLTADGQSTISNTELIDRGYADIVSLFYSLGADIFKI